MENCTNFTSVELEESCAMSLHNSKEKGIFLEEGFSIYEITAFPNTTHYLPLSKIQH